MRVQRNNTGGSNPTFQPMGLDSFRLSQYVLSQYTQGLRAEPLAYLMHDIWDAVTSVRTFGLEISAKYALGEMQRSWTNPMIYRMPGPALSAMYPNAPITVALSFTMVSVVTIPSPSRWLSRQTITSFPIVANDCLPLAYRPFEKRRNREADTQRSAPDSLDRFGMSGNPPYVLVSPHGAAGEAVAVRTAVQRKRMQSVFGLPYSHPVVQSVTTSMSAPERQALQQQLIQRAQIHTAQPTGFVQQTLWRDGVPGAYGKAIAPVGLSPQRGLRPEIMAQTPMLLSLSGAQPGTTPVQGLGNHSLPHEVHAILERRQTPGGWQSVDTPWSASLTARKPGADVIEKTRPAIAADLPKDTYRFTVIRREERLEPPRLSYALAQMQRPVLQAEPVVTKVREQEVVKVVQKEVQSYMASGAALKHFSRADYVHIAEHVYASLARRLMVEKERLGLR